MFWTDIGAATPKIVRANMDGSQVMTIISGTDVVTPTALAIDTACKEFVPLLWTYSCKLLLKKTIAA